MQTKSTSSTYKTLHTPWCLSILVGRVSLVEYLFVLRVLFPLLQMVPSIIAIAGTASILPWMRSEPWAGIFNNPCICFCGL